MYTHYICICIYIYIYIYSIVLQINSRRAGLQLREDWATNVPGTFPYFSVISLHITRLITRARTVAI